ncbi:MAG: phenylalanyl-tRNA synthetase beta chain [Oleispira sp.]|jgi:phenylalanyl-tRNA synthetase beta chain
MIFVFYNSLDNSTSFFNPKNFKQVNNMQFSELWLREWANPALETQELVDQITMAGLEVDAIEAAAGEFSGICVAQIVSFEQHPDADKLNVCKVTNGSEEFQIVCGAPNVREGMKIPFAKIGAVLPGDFKIKKAKLRGVESFGMLCAEEELGISEKSDGLWDLPADAPLGTCMREYLGLSRAGRDDKIIDVDLTPNRGDCLSIAGLSREVGVLNKVDVTAPTIKAVAATIDDAIDVQLQAPDACPRYVGRIIKGINIKAASPLWMQEKLRRSGIRSIDPVVDVTNFVLLELGQPMHAFDLAKLDGGIVVRKAVQDETLVLLGDQEIKLNSDTLVIADNSKALAMAGVMGGAFSGVNAETTQDILLESAYFNPISIAGKARNFGLHTDSSHRFERGVDFELQRTAIERATALLLEIVGGEAGPVVEKTSAANLPSCAEIVLIEAHIEKMLGLTIEASEVEEILTRLGMKLSSFEDAKVGNGWKVIAPSYRFDMEIEADLIEELARIYGYNRLPVRTPTAATPLLPVPENELAMKDVRRQLVGRGYQEAITYSFVDPAIQKLLDPDVAPLALANPISADLSVMRTNLWAGLVQTAVHNIKRQQPRVRLFETGLSFVPQPGKDPSNLDESLVQDPKLGMLLTGTRTEQSWSEGEQNVDFFDLKGDFESLIARTGSQARYTFVPAEHPALQPGQTASIQLDGVAVGWIGALHPNLAKPLGLKQAVYLLEISLKAIRQVEVPTFKPLSKFPGMSRDLALVVTDSTSVADVMSLIREKAGDYLTKLNLFDIYQGKGIDPDRKSLALGLTWQHPSRTLNEEEVNEAVDNILAHLADRIDAQLRG